MPSNACPDYCMPRLMHAQIVACPVCCMPRLLHAQIVACPHCCMPRLLHAQVVACTDYCMPRLLHAHTGPSPDCCMPRLLHAQIVLQNLEDNGTFITCRVTKRWQCKHTKCVKMNWAAIVLIATATDDQEQIHVDPQLTS